MVPTFKYLSFACAEGPLHKQHRYLFQRLTCCCSCPQILKLLNNFNDPAMNSRKERIRHFPEVNYHFLCFGHIYAQNKMFIYHWTAVNFIIAEQGHKNKIIHKLKQVRN